MQFVTWYIRSLYKAISTWISNAKLWSSGSTRHQMWQEWKSASRQVYIFLWKWECLINIYGQALSYIRESDQQFKRITFITDRMLYMHCRCAIILNMHAPTGDKSDDTRHSFYKDLENISYHIWKIWLDCNAKVGSKILSNQQSGMRVYMKFVMSWQLKYGIQV
jgi:hypothetical protein